jgi:hypothetical protein
MTSLDHLCTSFSHQATLLPLFDPGAVNKVRPNHDSMPAHITVSCNVVVAVTVVVGW